MKNKTSFLPREGEAQPSRCPDNSAFKQQRLPAWKPQLTIASVLSSFFLTGAFCLTVGVCLVLSANSVREVQIDYSDKCSDCSKLHENSSNWNKECHCSVHFMLQEDILGDVFMYYGLQNFYQNHHRYMISRSDAQLLGRNVNIQRSYCAPFSTYRNGTPVAPCGAIANSMFNDTIDLFYNRNSSVIQVPLLKTGNSWWTDKNVKFHNPESYNLSSAFAGTARPPYWQKPVYLLDKEDERKSGYVNDDFIVWMRVSAFATFRNLYRRVRRVQHFVAGLPAGNYTFRISYNILSDSLGLLESYSDVEVNGICVVKWQRNRTKNSPVSAEPARDLGHVLTDRSFCAGATGPSHPTVGTLLATALLLSAGVMST